MSVTLDDGGLAGALSELARLSAGVAVKATVNQMAEDLRAITPRRSGDLVGSLKQSVSDAKGTIGYTVEYAPHVEYGHRQNVGQYVPRLGKSLKAPYVEGQHFLSQEAKAGQAVLTRRVGEELRRRGL